MSDESIADQLAASGVVRNSTARTDIQITVDMPNKKGSPAAVSFRPPWRCR